MSPMAGGTAVVAALGVGKGGALRVQVEEVR